MTPAPDTPPLSPVTTFQNQVNAGLRHAVTAGGTLITVLGVFALLPADKAQDAVATLQTLGNHLELVFGDLSKLWLILGPALIALAVKGATFAASLKGQLRSIARNPAVDIKPQSEIVVPPAVAKAVPIPQVIPPADAK